MTMRILIDHESQWNHFAISFPIHQWEAYDDGEVSFYDPDSDGTPMTSIRGSVDELKELRKAIDDAIELAEKRKNKDADKELKIKASILSSRMAYVCLSNEYMTDEEDSLISLSPSEARELANILNNA